MARISGITLDDQGNVALRELKDGAPLFCITEQESDGRVHHDRSEIYLTLEGATALRDWLIEEIG